eukprot:EG_transcript_2241
MSRSALQSVPLVSLNQLSVKLDALVQYETVVRGQMMDAVSNAGTIVEDFEKYVITRQLMDQGIQRKALEVSMAQDGVNREQTWRFLNDGCVIRSEEDFANFMAASQTGENPTQRQEEVVPEEADWGEELGELDDVEDNPLRDTLAEMPRRAPGSMPTLPTTLASLRWKLSVMLATATRLLGKAQAPRATHFPSRAWVSYSLKNGKLFKDFMSGCTSDVEFIEGELQYKEEELQDVRQQLRAAESCTAELQEALQIEKEKLIALLMEPLRKTVAEKGVQVEPEPVKFAPPVKSLQAVAALRRQCATLEAEARWMAQEAERVSPSLKPFICLQRQRLEARWRLLEEQVTAMEEALEALRSPASSPAVSPRHSLLGSGSWSLKWTLASGQEAATEAVASLQSDYELLQDIVGQRSNVPGTPASSRGCRLEGGPPLALRRVATADSEEDIDSGLEDCLSQENGDVDVRSPATPQALRSPPSVAAILAAPVRDGPSATGPTPCQGGAAASPSETQHGHHRHHYAPPRPGSPPGSPPGDRAALRQRHGRPPLVRLRSAVPASAPWRPAASGRARAQPPNPTADDGEAPWDDALQCEGASVDMDGDPDGIADEAMPLHQPGHHIPRVAPSALELSLSTVGTEAEGGVLLDALRQVDATLQDYCCGLPGPDATGRCGAGTSPPVPATDADALLRMAEELAAVVSSANADTIGSLAVTLKTLLQRVAGLVARRGEEARSGGPQHAAGRPTTHGEVEPPPVRDFAAQKEATRRKWDAAHRRQLTATRRRVQAVCLQRAAPGPDDLFWGPRGLPLVPILEARPQSPESPEKLEETIQSSEEGVDSAWRPTPSDAAVLSAPHDTSARAGPTASRRVRRDRPGTAPPHGVPACRLSGAGQLYPDSASLGPWEPSAGSPRPSSAAPAALAAGAGGGSA